MKDPSAFSVDEVCLLLVSLELGHLQDKIRDNGVDGGLLVSLSETELVQDLGLSTLQAKRVTRGIAFCKELAAGTSASAGGEGTNHRTKELEERIRHLEKENRELKDEVLNLRAALQPEPPRQQQQQQPPPQQQHHQEPRSAGRPVIRGAAGGAARGAVIGAVAGAVAGTL